MSEPWPLRKRLVPLVVAAAVLTPIVIRGWPEIVTMWPAWRLMLGQTAILLAAGILLAAVAAIAAMRYRRRGESNA